MPDQQSPFQEFLSQWNLDQFPSLDRILSSMDPIAWTLVLLLVGAVIVGVLFSLSTRHTFLQADELETTPDVILAKLKQDPLWLTPVSIINRLGAESTLELLRYGDQITAKDWRFRWSGVREELLRLLSQQNAFGPVRVLARYYQSESTEEPDSLRIRRTVLIHKLGQRRYLEPGPNGAPAQLRLYRHPAELIGDLGFDGPTVWLDDEEEPIPADGPTIEMRQIEFDSVDDADVYLRIQRTPSVGGGFHIYLKKRRKMWVVVDEVIDWSL